MLQLSLGVGGYYFIYFKKCRLMRHHYLADTHGTCMGNWWDFFKAELASEYPSVDGPLTLHSYIGALEQSYENFCAKETRRINESHGKPRSTNGEMNGHHTNGHKEDITVGLKDFDYMGFHGPYGKLVQKGTARLVSTASTLQ